MNCPYLVKITELTKLKGTYFWNEINLKYRLTTANGAQLSSLRI